MRIACLYLPSFPLQAHVRQAPHLVGAPVVVADSGMQGSTVVACSRAAWEEGVRPGMATATARAIFPGLYVVSAEPELYEHAMAAVIDSAMSLCEAVDLGSPAERTGTHRVLYLRVPSRMRGDAFGQRLLAQLARQGFRGRVGVADDRFTAQVAAVTVTRPGGLSRLDDDARSPVFHQSCTTVPRGGSAAFLAPLPLSFLPIDSEVQGMLQTCGVKTLGDFAALPPPSVSRGWTDVDFRALARGQGPSVVRGVTRAAMLERRVVEQVVLPPVLANELGEGAMPAAGEHATVELGHEPGHEMGQEIGDAIACACATCETTGAEAWSSALHTLCDRIAHRLDGRERMAVRLVARLRGPAGAFAAFDVVPERPTASSRELLEALLLHGQAIEGTAWTSIDLAVVQECEPQIRELALFDAGIQGDAAPAMAAAAAVQLVHASEPDVHFHARFAATTPRLAHRSPSPTRGRTRRRMPMQQQLF
jgi:impB/mucB/samB family